MSKAQAVISNRNLQGVSTTTKKYCRAAGALLGALHLQFRVGRHGGFEADVRDCKGPRNAAICAQGKRAVAAFCDWL